MELIAYRPVVLNLGGTEPHQFHMRIHRTLLNWKNKILFFQIQNIGIYLTGAQNEPCINITVFKEQNHQNMIFTQKQKHNNEYLLQISVTSAVAFQRPVQKCAASPWQVPLSCHFRNKVCSFSSFLCPASSKRIARKDML